MGGSSSKKTREDTSVESKDVEKNMVRAGGVLAVAIAESDSRGRELRRRFLELKERIEKWEDYSDKVCEVKTSGSVSRSTCTEDSDLDIMIEFKISAVMAKATHRAPERELEVMAARLYNLLKEVVKFLYPEDAYEGLAMRLRGTEATQFQAHSLGRDDVDFVGCAKYRDMQILSTPICTRDYLSKSRTTLMTNTAAYLMHWESNKTDFIRALIVFMKAWNYKNRGVRVYPRYARRPGGVIHRAMTIEKMGRMRASERDHDIKPLKGFHLERLVLALVIKGYIVQGKNDLEST